MKSGLSRLAIAAIVTGLTAPAALSQSANNPFLRGRHVAVQDRVQPAYEPLPLRAGAFNINSNLTLAANYHDNVFADPVVKEAGTVLRARPEVRVNSTWSSHEVAFGGYVDHAEYVDQPDETTTEYGANLRGSLDVARGIRVSALANTAKRTEPRYEIGAQGALTEPTRYTLSGGALEGIFQRDRLQINASAGVNETDFERVDQAFRNVNETYVNGRLSVAVSPDLAVFVQGRAAELEYESVVNVIDRNSTLTDIQVGMNFEAQGPFRGEFSAGVIREDKDSDLLPDTEGLSLNGSLQWFPTQLTTIAFGAGRMIYDPGIVDAGSAFNTFVSVRADHELMRNLVLFGSVTVGEDEIEGAAEAFERLDVLVGAGYRINRNLRLDFNYSYLERDVFGAQGGPKLEQQVVGVALRISP